MKSDDKPRSQSATCQKLIELLTFQHRLNKQSRPEAVIHALNQNKSSIGVKKILVNFYKTPLKKRFGLICWRSILTVTTGNKK